jgi:hypothetical protein
LSELVAEDSVFDPLPPLEPVEVLVSVSVLELVDLRPPL